MLSGVIVLWKSHRRTVLSSWQTANVTSMSKWSLQQLLDLLFSFSNETAEVSVPMPFSTADCFPVPSFWGRKLKQRHTAQNRTAAAGLSLGGWEGLMLHDKSWKNHNLPGSSDRGCGWNTDVLYDRHLCRRDVDKTIMINHHSQGVNEGKNVHEDISKLGWSWQRPLYVWKKYKQWCKWSRWDE